METNNNTTTEYSIYFENVENTNPFEELIKVFLRPDRYRIESEAGCGERIVFSYREDMDETTIPVDSIYTPIERVNMTVEDTRVGQITDYDKLTLDVWTKGNIDPSDAVSLAAKVLSEHLQLFIDLSDVARQAEVMVAEEDDEKESRKRTTRKKKYSR